MINLDEMAQGYIAAALWADCQNMCNCPFDLSDESGDHSYDCATNESGGLERLDVSAADRQRVRELCRAFASRAGDDLLTFAKMRRFNPDEGSVWEHVGHDLRLTSAGHGTGFWDRNIRLDVPFHTGNPDAVAFSDAQRNLSNLAHSKPFDRSGGGDVWQVDEHTACFDI